MENIINEISSTAAVWWMNTLVHTKYDNGSGDDSLYTQALVMLGRKNLDSDIIQLFCKELKDKIKTELELLKAINSTSCYILSCDYGPCQTMQSIAQKYGIPNSNFPFKTTMWIGTNYIKVKYGYSSNIEIIYGTEDYYKTELNKLLTRRKEMENKCDSYFTMFTREEMLEDCNNEIEELNKAFNKFKERGCRNELPKLQL